jgi:hypothetical protein
MSAHLPGFIPTPQEKLICPICNMGSGHKKRSYIWKDLKDGSTRTPSASTPGALTSCTSTPSASTPSASTPSATTPCASTPAAAKPEKDPTKFDKVFAFDKHITERHERIFYSINTSEYICTLCPCDSVALGIPECSARFPADQSMKQDFLRHLRTAHAQAPENLIWYHVYLQRPLFIRRHWFVRRPSLSLTSDSIQFRLHSSHG